MITKTEKTEFAIASIPYLSKVPIMATFFLQKTYASTCFCQPKEIQRGVSLLGEKAKSDNGAQRLFYKEQQAPQWWECPRQAFAQDLLSASQQPAAMLPPGSGSTWALPQFIWCIP